MTCDHTYETTDYDGNTVSVKWSRMFCPDCGTRLEAPGPTKPFHLKPHQR
jgi:hypothetical protein